MWYRDGVSVVNGSTLTISSASSSDFGRYECNATGDGGTGSAATYISEQNALTLTSDLSAPPSASLHSTVNASDDQNHYNIDPGSTFSVRCSFQSPNDFDLFAFKDSSQLTGSSYVSVSTSTTTSSSPTRTTKELTIQLTSFSAGANGVYQCNASNSARSLLSRSVLLSTGAPTVERVSEEFIELIRPNPLVTEVTVDGAYSSLRWYREGVEVTSGGNVSITDFSRKLTISSTAAGDAGQYEVIATNDTGNVSVVFEVLLFNAPNFTITTDPEVIVIEDNVTVTCSVQSFPQPSNLRLTFGGANLTVTTTPVTFSQSSRLLTSEVVYTVTSAMPTDDEGNYTCSAEVTRGGPSSTTTYSDYINVDVNGPTAPNVTVTALPDSIPVGGSGILVCEATGGQPATYTFTWSDGAGETVTTGVTTSRGQSNLTISDAGDDSFGMYTCTVSSVYWNATGTGNITELELPVASFTPSQPDPVVFGTSIELNCLSVGRAPFNLSISVGGRVLASTAGAGRSVPLRYTLEVTDDSNYTTYTCLSENSFGSDNTTVTVVRARPPVLTRTSNQALTVTVRNNFALEVSITGYNLPIDSITWQRGSDSLITANNQFSFTNSIDTLGNESVTLIAAFTESLVDDDTYTLTVSNPAGNDSVDFDVTVQIIPEATLRESFTPNVIVREFGSVSVICDVTGTPPPNVTWTFGNRTVMNGSEFSLSRMETLTSENNNVTSTLTILNANREDLDTIVSCEASNGVGTDVRVSTSLVVEYAPNITFLSGEQTVLVNSSVNISCRVDTFPSSTITWYLDNEVVSSSQVTTQSLNNRTQESTVTISSVGTEDSGTYRCEANNSVSTNMTTTLTVEIGASAILDDLTVNETESADLTCTVTGTPQPNITWYVLRDGSGVMRMEVVEGTKYSINESVSTGGDKNIQVVSILTVSNTTMDDTGVYTCNGSNGRGSDEDTGRLTVQLPPTVVPVEPVATVINLMDATLSFVIRDDFPAVTPDGIYWIFNDVNGTEVLNPITSGDRYMFSGDNLNLTLRNVSNALEGKYTLVATNAAGSGSASVQFIVEAPPRFVVETPNQQAVNGTEVTIQCYAVAEPLHRVTWFFTNASNVTVEIGSSNTSVADGYAINSVTVIGSNNEPQAAVPAEYGSLTILNIQYGDRGVYRCRPENRYTAIETSTAVNVQVTPFVLDTSPRTDVLLGTPGVVINCTIRGFPLSSVVWSKGGIQRPPNITDSFVVTTLRAQYGIAYPLDNVTATERFPTEGLEYFDAVSFFNITRGILREDTDNYTCSAVSTLGDSTIRVTSDNIEVFVLEDPDVPGNVTISESSARYQVVTWDTPFDGNSPITGYQVFSSSSRNSTFVQIFPPLGRKRAVSVTPINETAINVTDLIPFVSYWYSVSATNAIGTSDSSQPSNAVQTDPAAPDIPPTACVLTPMNSTIIIASWTAPDPPNGIIANYTVKYRPVRAVADYDPSLFEGMTNTNTGTNSAQLVATGLQEAVEYMFEISVINQVGEGPPVTCSQLTNENTPAVPQSVDGLSPSSTSIVVSWDHPLPQDQNGLIVNYTVLSQLEQELNMTSTNGNRTTLTLTDLDVFTNYTISVMAHTSAGAGDPSAEIVIRTLNDTSSPPQCVTINTANNDSLTVSWYAPASPRGIVTDYTISFTGRKEYDTAFTHTGSISQVGCTPCTGMPGCNRSDVEQFCCVVPNLTPGTNYTVDVAAINGAGIGERSEQPTIETDVTIFRKRISFQLYIYSVTSCLAWSEFQNRRIAKLSSIEDFIQDVMTDCVHCNVTYVAESLFSCFGTDVEKTVVFLAEVAYTYSTDSSTTPLRLLQNWVSQSPLIAVDQQQLRVNGSCQVEVDSLRTIPRCILVSPMTPPPPSSTPTIIGVVCSVVVLIGLSAAILILVICIRRQAKRKHLYLPNLPNEYDYMPSKVAAAYINPLEMQKNPAYKSTQCQGNPEEGDDVYDYIIVERDRAQEQREESTYM